MITICEKIADQLNREQLTPEETKIIQKELLKQNSNEYL